MRKMVFHISFAVMGFIGIAILLIGLTSMGLPTAIRLAAVIIPGELTLTGYQGRFIDKLSAQKIEYHNDNLHILIENAKMNWRGVRLLTGTVDIQDLIASKVVIERFGSSDQFDLNSFRSNTINVLIDNLQIDQLEVNDSAFACTDIQTTLAFNELGLRIRNLHLTHPESTLELQANVGPGFDPPIKLLAKEHFTLDKIQTILGETHLEGDLKHLTGQQIFTEGLDARLDIIADNIGPEFTLTAKGQADIDSLNRFEEHLTGEMHVALDLSYDHTLGLGHVLLKSDKSRVNGKPFQLNFDGQIKNYIVTWNNNQFIMGRNKLITSGEYGPDKGRISWNIAANQLADMSDEMSGKLESKGQYEFNQSDWSANVELLASQLHIGSYAVEQLEIKPSKFGSLLKNPLNLNVKAEQLFIDELMVDQFELKASGTTENHLGSLKLQAYHTLLESSGKLTLNDNDDFHALLQNLSLVFADDSHFVLEKPTQINWVNNILSIQPNFCLKNDGVSSVCIHNTAPQTFKIQLTNLPNQLVGRYFTNRFRPSGRTDAQADLTLDGLAIQTLNLQGKVSPMEIRRGKKTERTFFEMGGAEFQLSLDSDHLKSTGYIALINPDRLDWSLDVQDWNELSLATLSAKLTGNITRWDPLRLYITDTNDFSGKVNIDLKAQGKVLEPTYQGALTLSAVRLAIPSQGLTLQDGHLTITPTKNHEQLEITGGLRSGEGTVAINGFLSLEDRWPSLDVLIKGERFTLSNTTSAIVFASPNLRVQTEEHLIDVTGELHIPEASLNIKGYSSYVAPSPDIIIIQENGRIFTPFYELNTRVLLSLGDAVSLKASNLDTGVGGQVHLTKLGNASVRATGQILGINGKYAAYGRKIDLSQAVLTFNNSPIDNPALFIEASRKIQMASTNNAAYLFADPTPQNKSGSIHEGTVGLRITGTVQSPKYTFYSNPPMSEADQLSYLMTGAPSSQIGTAQAAFMFAALTETSGILGVSDTDAARLQNITRTLGIDFNIESGSRIDADTGQTISDTNLVVGKSIHPRLYVSYTVGLLDPLNMFRVRYQLSRHWAVQSQANSQGDTGGDILYGIETDSFLGID